MRLNRESEADRAAKEFAKKQVGKVAKTAGKAAGKAGLALMKHFALCLAGLVGAPLTVVILVVAVFLLILPSLSFTSGIGADAKYDSSSTSIVGVAWEDDAQLAINQRYNDLREAAFWNDLAALFSTGQWGQSGSRFSSTFANAADADATGTDGYFSSTNRLMALTNEAFRLSMQNGRIKNQAESMANQAKAEVEQEIATNYPKPDDIDPADYRVVVNVEPDPEFGTSESFVYESSYLIAAASIATNNNESFDMGVRQLLDIAFDVTGLDRFGSGDIVWTPYVATEINEPEYGSYETTEGGWIDNWVFDHYEVADAQGRVSIYYSYAEIPEEDLTRVVIRERNEPVWGEVIVTKRTMTVNAKITYSAHISSDYKDIINRRCELEDSLPAGTPAYEITQVQQAENSALELAKFYGAIGGDWAEVGEAGLPLPRGTYYISSVFGRRFLFGQWSFHKGIDLAAAQGTPVYAVKDGTITVPAYDANGYGNWVKIDHGNGLETRYGHMSSVIVSSGQTVSAGDLIGYVGSTGQSTGPHLHFEVRTNNTPIDPLSTELGPLIREAANG